MSRRRKGLEILMRARMRSANQNEQEPYPLPPPTSLSFPPHHDSPDLVLGPRPPPPTSSSAAYLSRTDPPRAVALNDVKALMHASISTDTTLSGTVDTALLDFIEAYLRLSHEDRRELLLILARDYDVNRTRVRELMRQYLCLDLPDPCGGITKEQSESADEGGSLSAFYRAERNLRQALKPAYTVFFEHLNRHPGGLKLLATLRADLLRVLAEENVASLRAVDSYLKENLITWLSPANLELHQITWDDSASLLEKIVAYEAVHPIRNLLDLKRRLSIGRRCFGYLHPAIPGEPLIFIEVALLKNMAQTIEEVLWENPPIPESEATCALFYSISSTQPGLSGINLGKFLIKRVVELLKRDMPYVLIFATLSPIPGYLQWLLSKLASQSKLAESGIEDKSHMSPKRSCSAFRENLLYPDEEKAILNACMESTGGKTGIEVLENLLKNRNNDWVTSGQLSAVLQPPLMRLCARYLLKEKKRGKALDAVANFHLQNGAMIERINWMADQSEKGICQSGGIMVNYVYRLEKIKENAQLYFNKGHIEASPNLLLILEEQDNTGTS